MKTRALPMPPLWVERVLRKLGADMKDVKKMIKDIGTVTATWRQEAKAAGLKSTDIERLSTAFEHHDLSLALTLPLQ